MMKMIMRMQKSQVSGPLIKHTTPGSAPSFRRGPYLAAGYTSYKVIAVGGAGGRSGDINRGNTSGGANKVYGAPGGGGGFVKSEGTLVSLPATNIPVFVGSAGAQGPDKGSGAQLTQGGDGTSSSFGSLVGGGGLAGTALIPDSTFNEPVGYGGEGGGNLDPEGPTPYGGVTGDTRTSTSRSFPDAGIIELVDGVTVYGSGGGAGTGAIIANGAVVSPASAGANGVTDNSDYSCPGGSVQSTYQGGYGGGVNVKTVTGGSNEYYGRGGSGANANGVVVIKLS